LGGFDKVFSPGYHEDLDIGWRARKHGLQVIWIPQAKVRHEREVTYSKTFPKKQLDQIKERNYLICHWKNLYRVYLWLHILAVLKRCLFHPGFIVPVYMALSALPQIISYRLKAKNLIPDYQVFQNAKS
jgi:GT2 family glycosyltransferase